MRVQSGHKYRLYPTPEQEQKFKQCGGNTRFVWNQFLVINKKQYEETKKFIFYYNLAVSLPKMKEQYPFLKESFSQSLQMVARNFDRSLKSFIKDLKTNKKLKRGFPKFKHKSFMSDSFTCPQKWRVGNGFVFIPKIGEVKWVKHRPLKGKPKSITITQDGDKWFCSVLCERDIQLKEKKRDNIVGCDLGLKVFATLSDNTTISNPKTLKRYEEKLAREQRRLSRKKKGGQNRLKQRMIVKRLHTKIKDVRLDFLHKASNLIATNYDGIVVENLNISGMMANHHLAKSIADVAWSEFKRQLWYKCLWRSKHFIEIDRFAPTSKTCSRCGAIKDMPLHLRTYNCVCGVSIDRDLNAAINILNLGLSTLGQSGIHACGEKSSGANVRNYSLRSRKKNA